MKNLLVCFLPPVHFFLGYQIERSVFELNQMKIERLNTMLFGHQMKSNSQKINANQIKSNIDLVLSPNDT